MLTIGLGSGVTDDSGHLQQSMAIPTSARVGRPVMRLGGRPGLLGIAVADYLEIWADGGAAGTTGPCRRPAHRRPVLDPFDGPARCPRPRVDRCRRLPV